MLGFCSSGSCSFFGCVEELAHEASSSATSVVRAHLSSTRRSPRRKPAAQRSAPSARHHGSCAVRFLSLPASGWHRSHRCTPDRFPGGALAWCTVPALGPLREQQHHRQLPLSVQRTGCRPVRSGRRAAPSLLCLCFRACFCVIEF